MSEAAAQELPYVPFSGTGKIEKTARNIIQMKNEAEEIFLIGIDPMNTRVTVVGTADPSFLTGGLWVRFSVELNKQGKPQSDLTELSIVELSEVVQPGAQADLAPGEDPEKQEGPIPYIIVGKVNNFRKGNLQVAVPGKALKLKLAEDAKITVDVGTGGLGLLRPGDEIAVEGKQYQPGKVVGDKVDITLVEPLFGKSKKKRSDRNKAARQAEERSKEEEEAEADTKETADKQGDQAVDEQPGEEKPADGEAAGEEQKPADE